MIEVQIVVRTNGLEIGIDRDSDLPHGVNNMHVLRILDEAVAAVRRALEGGT